MPTKFKGHRTGFNPTGSNAAIPNELGAPKTTFSGRGAVPKGGFKRFPGAVADVEGGNRRLSKSKHGDGGGSGTTYSGRTPFKS